MPIIEYLPQLAAGILGGMIGFVIRHLVASKHRKKIESEKLRFRDEITNKKRELEVTSKQEINRQKAGVDSQGPGRLRRILR